MGERYELFVAVLELRAPVEALLPYFRGQAPGRPEEDRAALARAFMQAEGAKRGVSTFRRRGR